MPMLHRKIDGPLCERCSYQLKSIDTDRCPECGHLLRPAPPSTKENRGVSGALVVNILLSLLVLLIVLPFVVGLLWGLVAPLFD